MEKKLKGGIYKSPLEYCDDMRLMIDNAQLYNKKNTRVHKDASVVCIVSVEESQSKKAIANAVCCHWDGLAF